MQVLHTGRRRLVPAFLPQGATPASPFTPSADDPSMAEPHRSPNGQGNRMAKNLLIVESPAKAKTINKYLGKDFQVLASYGHVRDLVPKEGAVGSDRDFAMNYEVIERNQKHVDAIAKAAKQADSLYLATDLDREGEAISWHIAEILRQRGLLEGKRAASRGVLRDHPTRDQGGRRQPARTVDGSGQRATGATRARLPGRLQPLAGTLAQGAARPVRRPRAIARAAHDRGARRGDRGIQGARILVGRSRAARIRTRRSRRACSGSMARSSSSST